MSEGAHRFQPWFDRFWQIAGAVSVRAKITGIILGLVLMLGVGVIPVVRQALHEAMIHELEARAISVAQDLASRSTDLILINNLYALQQLIVETQANHPDIRYVFILDPQGQVLVHTFGDGFPSGLTSLDETGLAGSQQTREQQVNVLTTTEGPVWDVAAPIFGGQAGTARVGFSDLVVQRTMSRVTSQMLLATLLVTSVGLAAALWLTWVITRPILQLTEATRSVSRGDLSLRVPSWANDELGELADAFNAMVADLDLAAIELEKREQMRSELLERVISAQEEERLRIARDLHDHTSQSLVSLIVQLKLVETAPDPATRQKNLEELRKQLRDVLEDVRRMALDLRPGVLDDLGLVEGIRWFADRCRQDGLLEIQMAACDPCNTLPKREAVALYRVAQETLSNVIKHSQAKVARIELGCDANTIHLDICDDGVGFDVHQERQPGGGIGLFGMQERVQLLGGELVIESHPGQGTHVRASIPRPCEPFIDEEAA
jgi:signal transduction histidine kinase